jgi:hypothetical protein
MRRGVGILAAAAVVAAVLAAPGARADDPGSILLGGEGDRLNAYEVRDGEVVATQLDVPSYREGDRGGISRDTNGQICFFEGEDGETLFVGGEDSGQASRTPFFDALGLTDPVGEANGWGIFRLDGDRVGDLEAVQIAKLVPTYEPHLVSQYEHFGCGILSDGRIVTADIGDQYPGMPANGQLHLWFPPFDSFGGVRYCKIDVGLPTAGGIHIDDQDRIYIGAQRDDLDPTGKRAGVYRYTVDFPTSPDPAGGCGRLDRSGGAQMVDADRVQIERFIANGPQLLTPSSIVASPAGGFYVSSVFDGRINEYDAEGGFVREILAPPLEETGQPPYSTGTPLGLAIGSDGTLYYADLGVVVGPPPGPGRQTGSVRMIRFDAAGDPILPPIMIADGLSFPDGLGLLEPRAAGEQPPEPGPQGKGGRPPGLGGPPRAGS